MTNGRGGVTARWYRSLTGSAWLAVGVVMPAHGIVIDSASCPGALEDVTAGGSVLSRIIPAGGSATCITSPEAALGLEPYIRGSGGNLTLTINAGVSVPVFDLEGDDNTLANAGIASGDLTGNRAAIGTSVGSETSLVVTGDETQVNNLGILGLGAIGTAVNIANGGTLGLSIDGDGSFIRNDPDALLQAFIAGDGANIDNLGTVSVVEVQGDGAGIRNEGSTGPGIDGLPDGLGFLVVGDDAEVVNLGQVAEFSEPGLADEALGIAVQGAGAEIHNLGGSVVVEGTESVAIGVEGNGASIINAAEIGAVGTESSGVYVEGSQTVVDNSGDITVGGTEASGISIEGNGAQVRNSGEMRADGQFAAGVFAVGNGADIDNVDGGHIRTGAGAVLAAGAIGDGARVDNAGDVTTQGTNAWGLAVLGQDAGITNAATGTLATQGSNADAIVLGLQELPPEAAGIPIPPGVLGPAQGAVVNQGTISTLGDRADGIRGFAANSSATNTGTLDTSGEDAVAMILSGSGNTLVNGSVDQPQLTIGVITTTGDRGHGLAVAGSNSSAVNVGSIHTEGEAAAGLYADGTELNLVNGQQGMGALSGRVTTEGRLAHGMVLGVLAEDSTGTLVNHGLIQTSGESAHGLAALSGSAELHNQQLVTVTGNDAFGLFGQGSGNSITNHSVIRAGEAPGENGGDTTGAGGIAFTDDAQVTNAAGAEILVFGDSGHGIRGGVDGLARGADVTNDGTITLTGNQAVGITLLGAGSTEPASTVRNTGLIRAGVDGLLDPEAPPDPLLNPAFTPGANAKGVLIGGRATVINDVGGRIHVLGDDAVGIAAGDDAPAAGARVENRSEIQAIGSSAHGVDLTGDGVTVVNDSGGDPQDDPARIAATGANAIGIRTVGIDQFVHNAGRIDVSGTNSTLIEVNVTDDGELWVDSTTQLTVAGDNAVAMHVRSQTPGREIQITSSASDDAGCVGGGLLGGRIINCGGIDLNQSDSATGILVEGIGNTFIENHGGIAGTGTSQRGIVLEPADMLEAPEGQVNFIDNFGTIDLDGQGATGVLVNGHGNFFINGTGVTSFELAPDLPPELQLLIVSGIDSMTARADDLGNVDSQRIGAQGVVEVDGIGARAVVIGGDSNFVSNRLSQIQESDGENSQELDLPGRIVATGSGSIGVEILGSNVVVDNDGLIQGELFAVLGHDGTQTLINKNTIEGAVALGGGDDHLVFIPGADFTAQVDGGEGSDAIDVVFPSSLDLDEPLVVDQRMNGDRFTRFETFNLDLEPPVPAITLDNTLSVDSVNIDSGVLILDDAFLDAPSIEVAAFAGLAGSGVVGSVPEGDGLVVGEIFLADQATISAGNSPGELTFLGNVHSSAIFEIEIGGLDPALHDVINVEGDLELLGGELAFQFIDGFLPTLGDTFDFLNVSGLITGLDALETSFAGLPAGFDFDLGFGAGGLSLISMGQAGVAVREPHPEWLLLGGLGALLLTRRSARRRDVSRSSPARCRAST